jgi:hypothetical protein
MIITRTSPFTGESRSRDIPITEAQYDAWRSGVLIQNAMPHLTPGEREFILTGITDDEWDELFAEED